MLPFPLQMLLLVFAGWVSRQQLEVIEYLKEENRILKERLRGSAFDLRMPSGVGWLGRLTRWAAKH